MIPFAAEFKRAHRSVVSGLKNADHQIGSGVPACEGDRGRSRHIQKPDAPYRTKRNRNRSSDHFRQPWIAHAAHTGKLHEIAGAQAFQELDFWS